VTGATGIVGASVVVELLAAGEQVRAAMTRSRDTPPGADPVHFDFGGPSSWGQAFEGVDRLFLMRPPAVSDVKTYLRPVIRLAADRGVRHVVFLSVMRVNRLLPHWQVERDIETAALPHTFLRPSFSAQNLLSAYRSDIVQHDRIRLASGRGAHRSWTPAMWRQSPRLRCSTPPPTRCPYTLTGPPRSPFIRSGRCSAPGSGAPSITSRSGCSVTAASCSRKT
jgi:uncharacterized protein YbjT (DUF2867 family)